MYFYTSITLAFKLAFLAFFVLRFYKVFLLSPVFIKISIKYSFQMHAWLPEGDWVIKFTRRMSSKMSESLFSHSCFKVLEVLRRKKYIRLKPHGSTYLLILMSSDLRKKHLTLILLAEGLVLEPLIKVPIIALSAGKV